MYELLLGGYVLDHDTLLVSKASDFKSHIRVLEAGGYIENSVVVGCLNIRYQRGQFDYMRVNDFDLSPVKKVGNDYKFYIGKIEIVSNTMSVQRIYLGYPFLLGKYLIIRYMVSFYALMNYVMLSLVFDTCNGCFVGILDSSNGLFNYDNSRFNMPELLKIGLIASTLGY